jgi:hypothetical protein
MAARLEKPEKLAPSVDRIHPAVPLRAWIEGQLGPGWQGIHVARGPPQIVR